MAQKILIAMDESKNASRAVDFVANHLNPDASVTLFNVLLNTEAMCSLQAPELTPYFVAQQTSFCTLEAMKKKLVSEALDKAKEDLVQKGFAKSRVKTKIVKRKKGIARDIIAEVNTGDYDLVVLGKKGLSAVREFLMGSTAQKVMNGAKKTSVLLVD
jgi:nucleotide-binding universal stress UspA family protein